MSILEAFILGLIQGLSEFLPISSSGHIELAKALFGIEIKDDASFTIILHGGTV
ncbi:MAG: UDP-diphosphatase, partial [Flavobacteriales bacterium]|nr:UDP-diphosphatase [Flavobacteriales bacterium]